MLSHLPSPVYLGYTAAFLMTAAGVVWLWLLRKKGYKASSSSEKRGVAYLLGAGVLCGVASFLLAEADAEFKALPVLNSPPPYISLVIPGMLAVVMVYLLTVTIRMTIRSHLNAAFCLLVVLVGATGPTIRAEYLYFYKEFYAIAAQCTWFAEVVSILLCVIVFFSDRRAQKHS